MDTAKPESDVTNTTTTHLKEKEPLNTPQTEAQDIVALGSSRRVAVRSASEDELILATIFDRR